MRDSCPGTGFSRDSFFNIFNYRPPIVAFSSVGEKDSVRNCRAVGEFVYNLATRELAEQMNLTSAAVAPGVQTKSPCSGTVSTTRRQRRPILRGGGAADYEITRGAIAMRRPKVVARVGSPTPLLPRFARWLRQIERVVTALID